MKVGIVMQNEYPHVGLIRPRKLARSLRQAGHDVVFIAWNTGSQPLVEELSEGRAHRFRYFLGSRWFATLSAPFPLSPLWAAFVWRIARQENVDVLVGSNIRIALPAIFAARMLGIPFVLDCEENNPEAVRLYSKERLSDYIVHNSTLVGWLERTCMALADHTWVVVEERLATVSPRARRKGKVSVVCHTPGMEDLPPPGAQEEKTGPFKLMYVGLFAPGVGSVEPVLEALPFVLEQERDVQVWIAGGRQLEPLAEKLGVAANVVFSGVIPPDQVTGWLRQGDVGIIGYKVTPFTDTTISNKLFHYMAAGLAVLSTGMKPTRRVIEETGCGRVMPPGEHPREVAEVILEMKRSRAECARMGERGRQAIEEKYNWKTDFGHALEVLQRLVPGRRQGVNQSVSDSPSIL